MKLRFIGQQTFYFVHLTCMVMIAVGLPWSKFLMSAGAIFACANILLFRLNTDSLLQLRKHPIFILIVAIFCLHILGLLWSSNLDYGLNDLRKKLPFLLIPFCFIAGPNIRANHRWTLLWCFVSTVLVVSLINFISFDDQGTDLRMLSRFGSHIRLSLMIVASVVIVATCLIHWPKHQWAGFLLIAWFLYYTFYSEVISGALAIISLLWGILLYAKWSSRIWRIGLLSAPLASISLILILFTKTEVSPFKNIHETIHWNTTEGAPYYHELSDSTTENGFFIFRYICDSEINREWPKRSQFSLDSTKFGTHSLRTILYRYLTSKGLKKDAEGLAELTATDIQNIEQGFPNSLAASSGIVGRLSTLRYQLENRSNPNGSSLLQRLEYWKTAQQIIQSNFWLGVGTGDVDDAFQKQYETNNSLLESKYRLRGHNQFLTFWVSFGVVGVMLLFLLIYKTFKLAIQSEMRKELLLCAIVFGSILIEDTLESQTGVTLFAFIIGFFAMRYQAYIQRNIEPSEID